MLSEEDRRALLKLAREAVDAAARDARPPEPGNPGGALREKGAAFVTLRAAGDLRGCVGHIRAAMPLWKSVREMAAAAATGDSRFPPVRPEEVPGLEIEISVLSPMTPLRPEEIVVGTHGLYVRRGPRSGLLLPQVAPEWGWGREEFLRRTFEKAGLPFEPGSAEILGFTVEHFSEAART